MGIGLKSSIKYLQVLYAAYPEIAIAVAKFAPAYKVPGLAVMAKTNGLQGAFGNGILSALVANLNFSFIAQRFLQLNQVPAGRIIGRQAAEYCNVIGQLVHMLFIGSA